MVPLLQVLVVGTHAVVVVGSVVPTSETVTVVGTGQFVFFLVCVTKVILNLQYLLASV